MQLRRASGPADRTDVGAELALISRLAAVRRARYGYEQALRHTPLAHAKELARSADEIDTLIDLLWTEWAGVATAGDIATARRLATELVAAAGENPDPLVIAAAASSWGVQCWHEGRIDEAVTALDRAVLNHESAAASAPMGELINPLVDHRTICFGFHAMVHVMAGDPLDELPLHMMSAERLAPHQRMTMELTDAMRATLAHQWDTALLASERALAVETDAAFGFFLAAVHCVHGSALIALDRAAEGVAEMEAAIEQYLAMGAKTVMPFYMTRLAVGHLVLGDVAAAARTLERAQSVLDETGERWNEPYVLGSACRRRRRGGRGRSRGGGATGPGAGRGDGAGRRRRRRAPGRRPAHARLPRRLTRRRRGRVVPARPAASASQAGCKRTSAR